MFRVGLRNSSLFPAKTGRFDHRGDKDLVLVPPAYDDVVVAAARRSARFWSDLSHQMTLFVPRLIPPTLKRHHLAIRVRTQATRPAWRGMLWQHQETIVSRICRSLFAGGKCQCAENATVSPFGQRVASKMQRAGREH